jgi:hypothetical protein
MASTFDRLVALEHSLSEYKPGDLAQWSVAKMFNALLAASKQEHPDDPLIQAIDEATESAAMGISNMQIGTMRASIGQLLAADTDGGIGMA